MALRDIDNSTAANDFGNKYQYQYYGLASEFRNLTLTGQIDYDHFDPVRLSLVGEVTKNLAFDSSDINRIAVNNRGPSAKAGKVGAFEGGDTAWFVVLLSRQSRARKTSATGRRASVTATSSRTRSSTASPTPTSAVAAPTSRASPSAATSPSPNPCAAACAG